MSPLRRDDRLAEFRERFAEPNHPALAELRRQLDADRSKQRQLWFADRASVLERLGTPAHIQVYDEGRSEQWEYYFPAGDGVQASLMVRFTSGLVIGLD